MSSSSRNKSAFTLIELMVTITIIGILFAGSYIPYDYYSRLSRVHVSTERIHQALGNAKILAQNGQLFPGTTKNANVGLFFKKGSHVINMIAFLPENRSFTENENVKIIKTISLEDGVNINTLPQETILVEYKAPMGEMEIYFSPTETGSTFEIGTGWKQAISGALYQTIKIEK